MSDVWAYRVRELRSIGLFGFARILLALSDDFGSALAPVICRNGIHDTRYMLSGVSEW